MEAADLFASANKIISTGIGFPATTTTVCPVAGSMYCHHNTFTIVTVQEFVGIFVFFNCWWCRVRRQAEQATSVEAFRSIEESQAFLFLQSSLIIFEISMVFQRTNRLNMLLNSIQSQALLTMSYFFISTAAFTFNPFLLFTRASSCSWVGHCAGLYQKL